MANEVTEGHALTTALLKDMRKGYNLNDISERLGITPQEAHKVWDEYVSNRLTLPFEHQWILHLDRLEHLLTLAHGVLDDQMDADSVAATLKVLDRIEDMQALAISRKEKAQADLVQLTKQQVAVMFQVFSSVQAYYREALEEGFEQKTYKGAKEQVLGDFDNVFREITQKALTEVRNDEG